MDIKIPEVELLVPARPGRRRKFNPEEKRRMLDEAAAPGSSVSEVARRYGVSPSLLFRWRRLMDKGWLAGLDAGENVVPQSEVKQLQAQVRELERLHGSGRLNSIIPGPAALHAQWTCTGCRGSWGNGLRSQRWPASPFRRMSRLCA
jgi:transposase